MTSDLIIIKAKVKDFSEGLSVGTDVPYELDKLVKLVMKRAVERAKANGRRTVMAKDL
ncbi:DUF1931 domain-containing protein [Candidatus Woesearchaeota archaeon]|nr:DUF1931 domain-containing protein [Candidatus Woesearchaeota archaeon]